MDDARARCEAFELAHIGVRALVDAKRGRRFDQCRDDRVAPSLGARGRQLQHDGFRVPVGDDARQSVGFAVEQPASGVTRVLHRGPRRDGARDATREERGIDSLVRIERPDPRPDLRNRRVRGARDECAVGRQDVDGSPGLDRLGRRGNRTGENPGMTLPQRFLAARLERQRRSCAIRDDNDRRAATLLAPVSRARHRTGARCRR